MKFEKAFTLVELIIVIAIIAILAVGLLVGLDPLEQIAKARDTAVQVNMKELKGAIDRFYAAQGYFPGAKNLTEGSYGFDYILQPAYVGSGQGYMVAGESGSGSLGLSSSSELKQSTIQSLVKNNQNILVYPTSTGGNGSIADSATICFKPRSKQFQQQSTYRVIAGQPPAVDTSCPVAGTGVCGFCIE